MPAIGTVSTGRKTIHLYAHSGEVVEQQRSSCTEVTNHGNNQQQVSTTHYLFSALMMGGIGGGLIYWIYMGQKALLRKVRDALALEPA